MNRKTTYSLILLGVIFLFQPFLRGCFGSFLSLVHFVPIVLVFWAWKLDVQTLIWLICIGGLMGDFLVPDALGWGPVVMGMTVMLVRTQKFLLNNFGWTFFGVVVFAATFLYLGFSRLAFLVTQGYWSWGQDVSFAIVMASLFNTLLSPLFLWGFKRLYKEPKQRNVFLRNVRA